MQTVDDPDKVADIKIDRRTLPKGTPYREAGYEARQVIDIDIARFVTEYRAQLPVGLPQAGHDGHAGIDVAF